jgi:hypothetical protein
MNTTLYFFIIARVPEPPLIDLYPSDPLRLLSILKKKMSFCRREEHTAPHVLAAGGRMGDIVFGRPAPSTGTGKIPASAVRISLKYNHYVNYHYLTGLRIPVVTIREQGRHGFSFSGKRAGTTQVAACSRTDHQ